MNLLILLIGTGGNKINITMIHFRPKGILAFFLNFFPVLANELEWSVNRESLLRNYSPKIFGDRPKITANITIKKRIGGNPGFQPAPPDDYYPVSPGQQQIVNCGCCQCQPLCLCPCSSGCITRFPFIFPPTHPISPTTDETTPHHTTPSASSSHSSPYTPSSSSSSSSQEPSFPPSSTLSSTTQIPLPSPTSNRCCLMLFICPTCSCYSKCPSSSYPLPSGAYMTGPTLQQQNDNQFDQQQQQQRHIGQFQKGFRMNEFLDINTASDLKNLPQTLPKDDAFLNEMPTVRELQAVKIRRDQLTSQNGKENEKRLFDVNSELYAIKGPNSSLVSSAVPGKKMMVDSLLHWMMPAATILLIFGCR